jgi:hypothetical protein
MLDALIGFFTYFASFISDFFALIQKFWDFLQIGIYDFFVDWFALFVIDYTIALVKFKIYMVGFAWDIAQSALDQIDLSGQLSEAWSGVNSHVLDALTFFNVPDALNIILSAYVTRYVLKLIGL